MSGYESPEKALELIGNDFEYWTGKLNDSSVQLCYALIGANWAVFQTLGNVRHSRLAVWSIALVMATLMLNVLTSWIAGEYMRRRYEYAEANSTRWKQEWKAAQTGSTPWPVTASGEWLGKITRFLKLALPVIAGVLLLIGAWLKK